MRAGNHQGEEDREQGARQEDSDRHAPPHPGAEELAELCLDCASHHGVAPSYGATTPVAPYEGATPRWLAQSRQSSASSSAPGCGGEWRSESSWRAPCSRSSSPWWLPARIRNGVLAGAAHRYPALTTPRWSRPSIPPG